MTVHLNKDNNMIFNSLRLCHAKLLHSNSNNSCNSNNSRKNLNMKKRIAMRMLRYLVFSADTFQLPYIGSII